MRTTRAVGGLLLLFAVALGGVSSVASALAAPRAQEPELPVNGCRLDLVMVYLEGHDILRGTVSGDGDIVIAHVQRLEAERAVVDLELGQEAGELDCGLLDELGGCPVELAMRYLEDHGVEPRLAGTGEVIVRQTAPPGVPLEGLQVALVAGDHRAGLRCGPRPDLTGCPPEVALAVLGPSVEVVRVAARRAAAPVECAYVLVPDVKGLDRGEAEAAIVASRLVPEFDGRVDGVVEDQKPRGRELASRGSTVVLLLVPTTTSTTSTTSTSTTSTTSTSTTSTTSTVPSGTSPQTGSETSTDPTGPPTTPPAVGTPPPTPRPGADPQSVAGDGGRPSLLPGLVVGGGALAALAALALFRWSGPVQAQDAHRLAPGGRIRLVGDPGSFAIDHNGLPAASVTARFRTEQDTITLDEGERT